MKDYTLKPKAVKAVQFLPGAEIPNSVQAPSGSVYVHTPSGKHLLAPGCFLVVGLPGGPTVMSEADFNAAYDEVKKAKAPKADKPKASKKKVSKKKAAKKS